MDLPEYGSASQVTDARWLMPSGASLISQGLCMLARSHLAGYQRANDFRFFESTILLVTSGHLTLENGEETWELVDPLTLMAVAKNTVVNVHKAPDEDRSVFSSIYLTLAPNILTEFYQRYGQEITSIPPVAQCKKIELDWDLNDTLQYCLRGVDSQSNSKVQQINRFMGLLLSLYERGVVFPRPSVAGLAERLNQLLAKTPEKYWTAAQAGRELAVSEATLRRRLAEEGVNFGSMLTEIRMHHAMMLLQTTNFSVSQISDACGYRAISRFSMRFKSRFGFSPSNIR
jgi:AraC-like DNA-binding protein